MFPFCTCPWTLKPQVASVGSVSVVDQKKWKNCGVENVTTKKTFEIGCPQKFGHQTLATTHFNISKNMKRDKLCSEYLANTFKIIFEMNMLDL